MSLMVSNIRAALRVLAGSVFAALILPLCLSGCTSGGSGGKIVFVTNRDGNPEIYVMNPNGTNQTRLTNNPADDSQSSWSLDRSKIAFATNRDGNYEIYVMNADGTNPTRLTNHPATDYGPSWSPDGSKIAFTGTRDGNGEIYIMNANGSNPVNLTNNSADDFNPAWRN
jgi:Tol biopolymer transport system component